MPSLGGWRRKRQPVLTVRRAITATRHDYGEGEAGRACNWACRQGIDRGDRSGARVGPGVPRAAQPGRRGRRADDSSYSTRAVLSTPVEGMPAKGATCILLSSGPCYLNLLASRCDCSPALPNAH